MTTKLTVTSNNQETLKMNKTNLFKTMRRMAAVVALTGLSLVGMSFTNDDTTRMQDTSSENTTNNVVPADSNLTVTFMNGGHQIVINSKNAFNATVVIDNMDLNTWVNSLRAYSYKKINVKSISTADRTMDNNFAAAEKMNRKMASEFGKSMKAELDAADENAGELFNKTVAAPLFTKMVNIEAVEADRLMDVKVTEDAELMKQAVNFGKAINTTEADEEMDRMMNVSVLKNFSPKTAADADGQMDLMLNKANIKKITPALAQEADKGMDALLQNNK